MIIQDKKPTDFKSTTTETLEKDVSRLVTSVPISISLFISPTVESLWLSGRASERGIRRSEVRFLMEFFYLSHARDKTKNILLYFFTELKTYHLTYSIYKQNLGADMGLPCKTYMFTFCH